MYNITFIMYDNIYESLGVLYKMAVKTLVRLLPITSRFVLKLKISTSFSFKESSVKYHVHICIIYRISCSDSYSFSLTT